MDMLTSGLAHLTEQRHEHMSRPAVYARIAPGSGPAPGNRVRHEVELRVTQAPLRPDEQPFLAPAGAAPGYHAAERCDFLLRAQDLVLDGQPTTPRDGDLIELDGRRFEVSPRDGESCSRESDPLATTLRVHAVRVDDAPTPGSTNPQPPDEPPDEPPDDDDPDPPDLDPPDTP